MLGGKDEAAPMGGNGYGDQDGPEEYSAPSHNNYNQPAPSTRSASTQPASNIPEIDINEDEIPF